MFRGSRTCVDLGTAQRVHCTEHFYSFSSRFLYLWDLLPYEAELIFHCALALPFGHIFHASKEMQRPLPWPARPSPGKRHWVLVASAAMAGHASAFSEYQGCHRGPSRTGNSGLDLGTHRRQICREAEQQWREMPVCPSPYVY